MKKLIVAGVMALSFLAAGAQNKIGYISFNDVIGIMPEAAKADSILKEYQQALQMQGEEKAKDADEKAKKFVDDSAKLSETMKEVRRGEIIKLYQEVQNFNGEAQDRANKKAEDLIAPIRQKAMDAIKAVAKENGYAYILDAQTIIVGPPGEDIIALVKKKLGIKEPAAQPATRPAGKQ